jgi:hypothetical protein
MTGPGVSDDDMPNFPWPGRRDASQDASLAGLLTGSQVPDDLAAELQPAADVIAALRAAPASDELAGEAMALAEFRSGVSRPASRSRRRRPILLGSLLSAKVAAAAAVAVLGMGGVATAAYAGKLPAPVQNFAHDVVGAPWAAAHHHPTAGDPGVTPPARHRPAHRKPARHWPAGHWRHHWRGCLPVRPMPSASPTTSTMTGATASPSPAPSTTRPTRTICPPFRHRPWHPRRHPVWPHHSLKPTRRPARHGHPVHPMPHPSWHPSLSPSPRPTARPSA